MMITEPGTKRAAVFFDGQNLFYGAKEAFGYSYPNYSPRALADTICADHGWTPTEVFFYTGIPSAAAGSRWMKRTSGGPPKDTRAEKEGTRR